MIRAFLMFLALTCCAGCNDTPSAPTPKPPPTPVADPPEVICPAPIAVSALTSAGVNVTYVVPEIRKGEGKVTLACTPDSGSTFPIGVTQIECVATDSLSRKSSCTFSVTVAGPPRLRAARIMAFGDSLTIGDTAVGVGDNPNDFVFVTVAAPYPAVLGQLLSARYTDQTITVFNRGLSGEQASRALPRFIASFVADRPDVVVLQEGYNDYKDGATEAIGIENAVTGIRELAGEARRRGARVFICTLAPGRSGRRQILSSVLETINNRYRDVARAEGAVLVDTYSALLPDVLGNVSIDGLHLTSIGYRRVAETVFAAVRADLEVK